MLNIVNIDSYKYSDEAKSKLISIGNYQEVNIQKKEAAKLIKLADVVILRFGIKIDKNFLIRNPKLKYIITNVTGLNNLDQHECKKRGIKIFSLKNKNSFLKNITSTAELTLALVLNLSRRLPHAYMDVLKGRWRRDHFLGRNLYKKSVGIIGMGRNGKLIAKYCSAFGMKVNFFEKKKIKIKNKKYIKIKALKKILQISDFIIVCLSLERDTINFLKYSDFKKMKKNSFLINVSRGEIINELDLTKALKNKIIAGAALDVISNENSFNPKKNILINFARKNNNLIITPHIGGATIESWNQTELFVVNMFIKFIKNNRSIL